MAKNYDVIVVGAGNGGLAASVASAKQGHSTLLIEKNQDPGGAATSFKRGRFEFEADIHELAGYGSKENPGPFYQLFQKLGVNISVKPLKDLYRVITDRDGKLDTTLPTGLKAFSQKMVQEVPSDKEALKHFIDIGLQCTQAFSAITGDPAHIDINDLAKKYPALIKYGKKPFATVLKELGLSEKSQKLLSVFWPYKCVPTDVLDFFEFAAVLFGYITVPPTVMTNLSHDVTTAFIQSLVDSGGEVWFNTEVTGLIYENGAIKGVKIGDQEIRARQVISDVMPNFVYGKLLKPDQVPQSEVKKVNAREFMPSCFTAYLGLNKSPEQLGIKDYTIFMSHSGDPRKQFNNLHTLEHNDHLMMNCQNIADPNCSPKGTTQLFATQFVDGHVWDNVKPKDYFKLKNRIASKIIAEYEHMTGIKIQDSIEEIAVATPATFARYMGSPEGETLGYEEPTWDEIISRCFDIKRDEEPIKNLHFVGNSSYTSDGYTFTYMSGVFTANSVNQELSKEKV